MNLGGGDCGELRSCQATALQSGPETLSQKQNKNKKTKRKAVVEVAVGQKGVVMYLFSLWVLGFFILVRKLELAALVYPAL